MQILAPARPCWATVFTVGLDDSVWVELDSGSIVPIDAPPDVRALLEAGASVLVDVDASGAAVPWSTVLVTRQGSGAAASAGSEPVSGADQPRSRDLDDTGGSGDPADHLRTGMVPA